MDRVRMSLDGCDAHDLDEACAFVGRFARKAREQGWAEQDIERVCQGFPPERALSALRPHVEEVAEPLSWRHQLDRLRDYAEGAAFLGEGPLGLVRWWAKGLRVALKARHTAKE